MRVLSKVKMGWHEFWLPPDPTVQQTGKSGELAVARVRLLLVALVFGLGIDGYFRVSTLENLILSIIPGVYLFLAYVIYGAAKRINHSSWMGFATSSLDVTLVSSGLIAYLLVDNPHAAVNSQVLYPAYLVVIASTALRLDYRVCALVGLLALGQYAAIVSYAEANWDLTGPSAGSQAYGVFNFGNQLARTLLLAASGFICTVVVKRAQRPQVLSSIDSLTGLVNRRAFMQRLEGEVSRASRYGRPISVLMIDIDHFKQFNELYGHQGGDVALELVARTIQSRARAGDLVARYGGEEFVVALPETGVERAMAMAEQLRQAVATTPLLMGRQQTEGHVTVSIGVASWPAGGQVISTLLERADACLYAAKKGGRDQVNGPRTEAVMHRPLAPR